jgi:hypothetical protein
MNKLLMPPERFAGKRDDFGFEYLSFETRKLARGAMSADTDPNELAW